MTKNTTQEICEYLKSHDAGYTFISHAETRTSEESFRVRADRGFVDVTGAKALLMKLQYKQGISQYSVFVIPSHMKLNSKAIKQEFADLKSFRFATIEELAELTDGLVPGSLPPFAKPIFTTLNCLFIDRSLADCDTIAFNAASLNYSLILSTKDYLKIAMPTAIFDFSY
jgi:Ala-tRNA(Pro) deacylase